MKNASFGPAKATKSVTNLFKQTILDHAILNLHEATTAG